MAVNIYNKQKVTEEELKEIEEFQQNINLITYQLGQVALQRLSLEKQEEAFRNTTRPNTS
jgi:hypothetical protein